MRLFKTVLCVFLCLLCVSFLACEVDEEDECDKTEAPLIEATIHFHIYAFYQVAGQERQPMNNSYLDIDIWKLECNDESKGLFSYNDRYTGLESNYIYQTVGYNLDNTQDEVYIRVESALLSIPEGSNIFAIEDDVKTESLKYSEFQGDNNERDYVFEITFTAVLND